MSNEAITRLQNANDEDRSAAAAILTRAGEENRVPNDEENTTLEGLAKSRENRDGVIASLAKIEDEKTAAVENRAKYAEVLSATPRPEIVPGRAEQPYRPTPGGRGFFMDLYAAHKGDLRAIENLHRHNLFMENYKPEYRTWAGGGSTSDEQRAGTAASATSFGSFIPPVWLLDEYAAKARAGRVVPNLARDLGEPTSTSITIPRVTTGSAVTTQNPENTTLGTVDAVTAQLTLTTSTIGGYEDISVQSMELSPFAVDRFIFGDLVADYNRYLDLQTVIGTGANNQLLGLDTLTGVNAITYTDATPTVGEAYSAIANAIQQVHTGRFAPPDAILMHPRRWGWFLAASDTTGRPLITPYAPMNNPADMVGVHSFGPVGSLQGLPVYTDANIPITVGAGTEDEIYVARFDDMLLFEGPLRSEVFRDVGSANATVRFRVYAFANFFCGRYPAGVSRIRGTGLIAPVF